MICRGNADDGVGGGSMCQCGTGADEAEASTDSSGGGTNGRRVRLEATGKQEVACDWSGLYEGQQAERELARNDYLTTGEP